MEFKDISPELLEKMKACTSPEEFTQLAEKEGIELSAEMLEGVSGGWDSNDCPWFTNCPWYSSEGVGDVRPDIDPANAGEAYRSGKVGYAELDW